MLNLPPSGLNWEGLETKLDGKADKADLTKLETRLDAKIDGLETKLERKLDGKADKSDIARIEKKLDDHSGQIFFLATHLRPYLQDDESPTPYANRRPKVAA